MVTEFVPIVIGWFGEFGPAFQGFIDRVGSHFGDRSGSEKEILTNYGLILLTNYGLMDFDFSHHARASSLHRSFSNASVALGTGIGNRK